MKAEIEIYETASVVPGDGEEVLVYDEYGHFEVLTWSTKDNAFICPWDRHDDPFEIYTYKRPLWARLPKSECAELIKRKRDRGEII